MSKKISSFETIPQPYMVICGNEIMFRGSRALCLKYYDDLPKPMEMQMIKIATTRDLRRY